MKRNAEICCDRPGRTVYLSGVHGVGKTTLCNAVAQQIQVKHVTASSLLDKYAFRYKQYAKSVKGGESEFICQCIEEMLMVVPFLLVDSHCVLVDRQNNIVKVDREIFRRIRVQGIVLLVDTVDRIQERLWQRDGELIECDTINELQDAELEYSGVVANMLGVKRKIIDVSKVDFASMVTEVLSFIKV